MTGTIIGDFGAAVNSQHRIPHIGLHISLVLRVFLYIFFALIYHIFVEAEGR